MHEVAPKQGPFLLGAYGGDSGALAGATPVAFRWQPPSPAGSASCLASQLDARGFLDASLHKLPDLTAYLQNGTLHFKFTVKFR